MFTREQIVLNLQQLREEIEEDRTLSLEMACLLSDCCDCVGLSEAEAQHILGFVNFEMVATAVAEIGDIFDE